MTGANFLRAVVAGFIGTYVMTMTGFWQAGIGLPKMDPAGLMAANMGQRYGWGQAAHFLNGIILALIYARWVYGRLPGAPVVRGILFGLVATIGAVVVVVPLISASMETPVGIFFTKTPMPGAMLLGALVGHLGYGVALGLIYTPTEQT